MRIKIKDIPDEGLDWETSFDRPFVKDAIGDLDADLAATQTFAELHISKVGENVFARGHLRGTVTMPCSRCLAPAAMLVDQPVRITFTPEDELPPDEDVADDVEFATHDRQFVQLDEILREALIFTVPMTPLCRADCKGLCPICGQDRNVIECGCDPHPPDPRFAALKGLKV